MKYFNHILTLFLSIVAISLPAQKSDALLLQYQHEYQTFKEFIIKNSQYKGDTTIDVKFYHIDIGIGISSPWIEGNVMIRFEPVTDGLSALYIDLNSALQVDSISSPCENFNQIGDAVHITLDDSYNIGDQIDLTIYYHGEPVMAGGYKGLRYETHDNNEPVIATLSTPYLAHYWYPCKDGPEDKPDSVYMDITIPDTIIMGVELMAVSNGILEDVIINGNKKTFKWRHRYPIVTYYVMAAISNYVFFQEEFNGMGGESFPLDYYVFEDDLNNAQQGVEQLPEAIQFFSDVFGTYPFSEEKYGMTQLGFYGAIENQTNTIQNNLSLSWFGVSVHELGHMWFGDMITLADWHHCWLNEGFATYSEALWAEHQNGFEGYKNNMATNEFWDGGTLYLENALDTFNTFQNIFYSKGAYTVHMLRGVLGDDAFFNALLDYAQNPGLMYKNADTEDLQESFENSSGTDLGFFFEQWVYDEYFPVYHYNYLQSSGILNLIIYQAQEELYGYRPVFEMPVRLKLNFQNGNDTIIIVWDDQQTQNFSFSIAEEVSSVEFDPDKWILRHEQFNPGIPVGTVDFEIEESVNVYPNPFTDHLIIDYNNMLITSTFEYTIYNINGQLIDHEFNNLSDHKVVNTTDYPSGLYYIYLKERGKNGIWKKLIRH